MNQIVGKSASTASQKIIGSMAGGALIGSATGGIGALIQNMMNKSRIDKLQFLDYLVGCGATQSEALTIWLYLKEAGYIKSRQFTVKCQSGIELPPALYPYQDIIQEIYNLSADIWKNVWESAAKSAAIGGVVGGVTTSANLMKHKPQSKIASKKIIESSKL